MSTTEDAPQQVEIAVTETAASEALDLLDGEEMDTDEAGDRKSVV